MKLFDGVARNIFLNQLSEIAGEGEKQKYAKIVGAMKGFASNCGDTELYAALERATGDGEKEKAG